MFFCPHSLRFAPLLPPNSKILVPPMGRLAQESDTGEVHPRTGSHPVTSQILRNLCRSGRAAGHSVRKCAGSGRVWVWICLLRIVFRSKKWPVSNSGLATLRQEDAVAFLFLETLPFDKMSTVLDLKRKNRGNRISERRRTVTAARLSPGTCLCLKCSKTHRQSSLIPKFFRG